MRARVSVRETSLVYAWPRRRPPPSWSYAGTRWTRRAQGRCHAICEEVPGLGPLRRLRLLGQRDAEVDVLCETRLERFATVVVLRVADLVAAGVDVVPTFGAPHVTLAAIQLDVLVDRLVACQHETRANVHHQGGD